MRIRCFDVAALACCLVALGCGNGGGADAADGSDLVVMDENADVVFELDAPTDVPDAVEEDVAFDVTPAALPGQWRLVGWSEMGVSGTVTYTDDEAPGGAVRVNGMMRLASDRIAQSYGVLVNGHFQANPTGDATTGLDAFGTASRGTLGTADFSPDHGAQLAFSTNPDGTISESTTLTTRGPVTLTWQRADIVPQLSVIRGQGLIVELMMDHAAPMIAPRAALAWDAPGSAIVFSNDVPLTFIAGGIAAFNLQASAPPDAAVVSVGGTSVAVAYLVVYDDQNRDGTYDTAPATTDGADAGVLVDAGMDGSVVGVADVLRGVSPIALAWRSGASPSTAFEQSTVQDLVPGLQFGLVRADDSVPEGLSIGPFDPTHLVSPDGFVEPMVASMPIPDLLH